jgi:septum site-determining protein MinC
MDAPVEHEVAAPRSSREPDRSRSQAFELKGMVAPLTVLQLGTGDTAAIAQQLVSKVAQMPHFFQDAPVLVDLARLGADAVRVPFGELAALLRSCKMVPVAITNAEGDARTRAASAGFGYVAAPTPRVSGRSVEIASSPRASAPTRETTRLTETASRPPATAAARKEAAPPPPTRPSGVSHRPPMVIRQPVRSGQTIYAEGTDLVLLAPVNSGAEVIADGHLHIYSTLRGRAVAGAQGMTDARIFCQKLDAELISISGAYLLPDDFPVERRGKPAQIYLENGICQVVAL